MCLCCLVLGKDEQEQQEVGGGGGGGGGRGFPEQQQQLVEVGVIKELQLRKFQLSHVWNTVVRHRPWHVKLNNYIVTDYYYHFGVSASCFTDLPLILIFSCIFVAEIWKCLTGRHHQKKKKRKKRRQLLLNSGAFFFGPFTFGKSLISPLDSSRICQQMEKIIIQMCKM